jgi:hypothetical protein
MKNHILVEHPIAWCKSKSANVAFDIEKLHWKKSKKRFAISYGAITKHFGNANPYQKDDPQQQKFMEDLLFVAKTYMSISIVES